MGATSNKPSTDVVDESATQSRSAVELPDREYFTPDELCKRYKGTINVRTLANWRASGDGPPFTKVGGRVLYKRDGVEKWEVKRTKGDR